LIAVCGTSGGVGTTTVAINLAAAFAQRDGASAKTACVLVDGSLHFADQRVMLDVPAEATGIVEVAIANDARRPDILLSSLVRYDQGLLFLPGPASPEGGEQVDPERFGQILWALRAMSPITIVDVGRELTEPTLRAFDAARDIVLVTSCQLVALKNARLMLDLLGRLGHGGQKIRLVLNRVGEPGGFSPTEAAGVLDHPFDAQLPDDVPTVHDSLALGRPFSLGTRDTALARAIGDLATLLAKPR
jgi:pilus assembly protein CpaE